MGATTIEWCDFTFNHIIGCTKIAAGCTHCYAEAFARRYNKAAWGPHGTRVKTSEANWRKPLKWNREARAESLTGDAEGQGCPTARPRVFCASLADVFEQWDGPMRNHKGVQLVRDDERVTMDDLRRDLFALIDATPHLDWLLLTKRPENVRRMWPVTRDVIYDNEDIPHDVKYRDLGCSVSDQSTADKNIPELLKLRDLCPVLFVSAEPLLSAIDLDQCGATPCDAIIGCPDTIVEPQPSAGIDWLIIGGESGPGARPCSLAWIRSLVDQCRAAGVPAFVKQLGSKPFEMRQDYTYACEHEDERYLRLRDRKGGDISEWPDDLRVREFPTVEIHA